MCTVCTVLNGELVWGACDNICTCRFDFLRYNSVYVSGVNIKHFGLLALWGQWLMKPTGPTGKVILYVALQVHFTVARIIACYLYPLEYKIHWSCSLPYIGVQKETLQHLKSRVAVFINTCTWMPSNFVSSCQQYHTRKETKKLLYRKSHCTVLRNENSIECASKHTRMSLENYMKN